MAASARLLIPANCLSPVRLAAETFVVQLREVELSVAVAPVGGSLIPMPGPAKVGVDTLPVLTHEAEEELRVGVSLFGGVAVELGQRALPVC